ncbi:hypothetical protein FPV67DRAFT_1488866 [Lyophyllum atratum]|nr:hypothetical protein FPV67DRAFT_1488866 [Lyophyllum atratum]
MSDDRSPSPIPTSSAAPRRRRKGNTCLNCRRRKIRCDGLRPMCGQCVSGSSTFEDCEYPGGSPTPSQVLEQRISQIKARIRVLEDPEDAPGLALHHPYASDELLPTYSGRRRSLSSGSSNDSVGSNLPGSPSRSSPTGGSTVLEAFLEPPSIRRQEILDTFFSNARQFGFFLDPGRFYQSIMLLDPPGDPARPSPALLSTVYLWASHFSSSSHLEEMRTANALHYLSQDLSTAHPHRVIHSIQAEVLLSYYYLKNGKMLEGNHHADAALSLALAANLHRIRSPITSIATLPPSADAVEESERIDAFWAVLVLNNYWAAIQGSQSTYFSLQNGAVDTPWPMQSAEHEHHLLPIESRSTVQDFLGGRSLAGFSDKALHAKAAILFERATSIHTEDGRSILQSGAVSHLDSLIDAFRTSLPLVDSVDAPNRMTKRFVTQMLLHAATIRLHLPFVQELDNSYRKSTYAAQAIANLTSNVGLDPHRPHVDPIVGVIWAASCDALVPLVKSGSSWTAGNADLVTSFEIILTHLNSFSERNPLFKFLTQRYERIYSASPGVPSTSGSPSD